MRLDKERRDTERDEKQKRNEIKMKKMWEFEHGEKKKINNDGDAAPPQNLKNMDDLYRNND